MSETVVKKMAITFDDGLPLGVRGTFKNDGEIWIAVPIKKYSATQAVSDRLLGALARVRGQMTRWVSSHPEDAERVVMILETLKEAAEAHEAALTDKIEAQRP